MRNNNITLLGTSFHNPQALFYNLADLYNFITNRKVNYKI